MNKKGGDGMEKFIVGLTLGMLGGALITANNCKMRALVRKGQEELKEKFDEKLEEKLEEGEKLFPDKKKIKKKD